MLCYEKENIVLAIFSLIILSLISPGVCSNNYINLIKWNADGFYGKNDRDY